MLINYAPSHEDIRGNTGIAPPLSASAVDGGKRSASRPAALLTAKDFPVPTGYIS